MASESRGFAVARLLTHWSDIVGESTASIAKPVKVHYPKGSFGATLVLLAKGAHAPMLQAGLEAIRERVNACYGYNAISRIRITQTAPEGFAEEQAAFAAKPKDAPAPLPADSAEARRIAGVGDADLRAELEKLGARLASPSTRPTGS